MAIGKIIQRPGSSNAASSVAKSGKMGFLRLTYVSLLSFGSLLFGADVAHRYFKPDTTLTIDLDAFKPRIKQDDN
ncbi:hypothetical protein ABK040_000657 [Willaertia magna]